MKINLNNIKVREMKIDDWMEVCSIYQEGIDTMISTFQTEVPDYNTWDSSHLKICRLVAEAEGKVLGWTALSPYNYRKAYAGVAEVSVYVGATYRGNQIGEILLKELIRSSETAGIWSLQSGILEVNTASIALHKKVGFRVVGYRERIAQDRNGVWQNLILMEKRI